MHTLAEHRVSASDEAIRSIMTAYDQLSTFEDVIPALQQLGSIEAAECVVFSNGTREMIDNSMKNSDISPISNMFSQFISVDHLQSFKPAPEVYKYLAHCTEMAGKEHDIWLVSGNPFDVVGARAVGMNAAWVDRAGTGWQDKLGHEPTKVIRDLRELANMFS